jgi:hypothetical protein
VALDMLCGVEIMNQNVYVLQKVAVLLGTLYKGLARIFGVITDK